MNKKQVFFIADDDPDDQELFINALKEIDESCLCITAFDGTVAIEILTKGKSYIPDFIFLDLNMPRMNGKECLRQIKAIQSLQHIPVIIYSTSADKREMQEAIEIGAVLFLQKPNRFDELKRSLSQIIAQKWY